MGDGDGMSKSQMSAIADDTEFRSQFSAVMHHNRCSSGERFEAWDAAAGDSDNARQSYALMAGEIAWLRPVSDDEALLMMPNPDVDALEPWRQECEARYVLQMPTREARNEWIAKVAKKRSQDEADRLKAEVMRLWSDFRQGHRSGGAVAAEKQ